MALKGKPVAIGNTATTIYTCPATKEAAVHGLLFGNNTASALAVDVIVYNQATGSDVTVVTDLAVPANGVATWSKPINLNAGDAVKAVSSAASGMVCLYSTYEDGATPVASGFTARGVWSSGSTYAANDIVSVSGSGTYVAIQASTNEDPTTATAYWMFLEGISASALPAQSGNAGKYLTTDGSNASWGELDVAGGANVETLTADKTLTSSDKIAQVFSGSTAGLSVTLPDTTSLSNGHSFLISNKSLYGLNIKNTSGDLLNLIKPAQTGRYFIADKTTNDWEVNIVSNAPSLTSENSGKTTKVFNMYYLNPKIWKVATDTYVTMSGKYSPWGPTSAYFEFDSNGIVTNAIARNENYNYDNENARSNSFEYIGSSPSQDFIGLYNSSDMRFYGARVTSSGTSWAQDTTEISGTNVGALAKVGDTKFILFARGGTNTDQGTTGYGGTIRARVATITAYNSFSHGSTTNNGASDYGNLTLDSVGVDTDRAVVVATRNTSTSGSHFGIPYVWGVSVSGTTPSWGSPVALDTESFDRQRVRVCKAGTNKAFATWVTADGKLWGSVITVSGNTCTVGTKTLLTPSFPSITKEWRPCEGADDNDIIVVGHDPSLGGKPVAGVVTISGTSCSAGSFGYLTDALFSSRDYSVTHVIWDSEKGKYVALLPLASSEVVHNLVKANI